MMLYLSEDFKGTKISLGNKSAKGIYSCYLLNRLTKSEILDILKECKRVLMPNEIIRISVPDYYLISSKYLKSKCRIEDVNEVLNGSKIFLDFVMLQKLLIQAGFFAVKRYDSERFNMGDKSSLLINGENVSLNVEAYG